MQENNTPIEILLVEDNPDDEELMLLTLSGHNESKNSIKIVRDGAEALAYLFGTGSYSGRDLSQRPKLILLDLKLPKINGLEVLEQVKSHEETASIPVIVLTSSKEELDVERSYRLGANSYVVKPVDFAQFQSTIQQLSAYWQFVNEPPVH